MRGEARLLRNGVTLSQVSADMDRMSTAGCRQHVKHLKTELLSLRGRQKIERGPWINSLTWVIYHFKPTVWSASMTEAVKVVYCASMSFLWFHFRLFISKQNLIYWKLCIFISRNLSLHYRSLSETQWRSRFSNGRPTRCFQRRLRTNPGTEDNIINFKSVVK